MSCFSICYRLTHDRGHLYHFFLSIKGESKEILDRQSNCAMGYFTRGLVKGNEVMNGGVLHNKSCRIAST